MATGQWHSGDPETWIIGDSGYDGSRLAFLLTDLPVRILVRLRSDRVLRFPAPFREPGTRGRAIRHGARFTFTDPESSPAPAHATTTATTRYGLVHAQSWDRLHTKLTRVGAWADHEALLPIVEGTVVRLDVERLPGTGTPKPLWLWYSGYSATEHPAGHAAAPTVDQVDQVWQMFLRRFDVEHTFRFLKHTLGWVTPRVRAPEAADRWTWLMVAAYVQLRLARSVVEDRRRPWERKPSRSGRLSPVRIRRGFRAVRPRAAMPASAPKPSRSGLGRPPGSRNSRRAQLYDPGKATKTDIKA
jgi:hypothetical protein